MTARVPRHTVAIGRSVDGRQLIADVIGADSAPRKLLLVGCIHGNECAGVRILTAVARRRPAAGVQLWLVRELNPDGTAAGTRQNAHGVDLNRNFPFQWQRITDPTYDSGPHPASEPETRAAMALILRIHPAVTIWYHQHQDLVDMAGGDRGVARRYAQLGHLRPPAWVSARDGAGVAEPPAARDDLVRGRAAGRTGGRPGDLAPPAGGGRHGTWPARRLADQLPVSGGQPARTAAISASNSRPSSPCSGCHSTPTANRRPGSSSASTDPSGARAPTTRPSPTRSIP